MVLNSVDSTPAPSYAKDTRTRNRYRKLVPENWYQFSGTSFFVPDETGSKISRLIFLYYCPQIYFKAIKQHTTQLI